MDSCTPVSIRMYFFTIKRGAISKDGKKSYGLEDFIHTTSYVYTDMDADGDLDIVSNGINAPVRDFYQ